MNFLDPIQNTECRFEMLHRSKIVLSPYQRDLSTGLVNKLLVSVEKGFVVPLLVVENGELFEIIDGQHRIGAADKLRGLDYYVPSIIVPYHFKNRPLYFNIEKSDNIRDQATKIYNLYQHYLEEEPDKIERELNSACNYMSYLVSISFAYREFDISSPSLIEAPCKKLDPTGFLDDPLSSAVITRRNRGRLIRDLENAVTTAAQEYNIKDFQLKNAIVSQASQRLWGPRVRHVDATFEDGIQELITEIEGADWSWMRGR